MPLKPILETKTTDAVLEDQLSAQGAKRLEDQLVVSGLLGFVQAALGEAEDAREQSNVTDTLLDSLRRRKGEYDPAKKAQLLRQDEPDLFVPLTETKCNAAEAWMGDVLAPHGDKIWEITPTPIPSLSDDTIEKLKLKAQETATLEMEATGREPTEEDMMSLVEDMASEIRELQYEEAKRRAVNMSLVIEDQLAESNWSKIFKDFLSHLVTFGTGILKGPVVKSRKKLAWKGDKAITDIVQAPQAEVVNPLDFFPSPAATEVSDGYMIERTRLTRSELRQVMDLPYYKKDEIEELLTQNPDGVIERSYHEDERDELENKEYSATDNNSSRTLEVFEFWGPVPGEHLQEWGVPQAKEGIDYEFQVIWCKNSIIKVMANPDPLDRRPYHKATFKNTVGSFWGRGVPQLMKGAQDRANSAVRSLIVNMGMASGPQTLIDVSRLAKGETVTSIFPRRVWQTTNEFNLTTKPVDFINVDSNAAELQGVYDRAVKDADVESGVPAFSYGSDVASGAARTVGGLSILMNAAARGIKEAFADIDQNAIRPLITRFYVWNMLYSEDPNVKGDLQIVARGASGMLLRELQLQKLTEFMDRTNNPTDQEIMGVEGRAELLRLQAKLLNIDVTDIVPSEDELEKRREKAKEDMAKSQQAQQAQASLGSALAAAGGNPQAAANTLGTAPRQEEV